MNNLTFRYLKSLLMRQKKLLVLYFIVCFVSYPLVLFIDEFINVSSDLGIIVYGIYMLIMAFILPFVAFRFSFSKKQVDTVYSLPIKRKNLFDAHYFSGIAVILIIPFINFMIGMIIGLITGSIIIPHILGIMLCYLACAGVALLAYSFNTWLVNITNNNIDALIMIVSYLVLPYIVYLAWDIFSMSQSVGLTPPNIMRWIEYVAPINLLSTYLSYIRNYVFDTMFYFKIIYSVIIVITFYFLARYTFIKRKGEDSEQISTNRFTYPVVINVLSFAFITNFNLTEVPLVALIMYLVVSFVIFAIMDFVRRRSTKINRQLIIKYIVLLVAFNLFSIVSKQTSFFGLNNRVLDISGSREFYIELYTPDGSESRMMRVNLNQMTPEQQKVVDDAIKLQALATKQFKEGTYAEGDYEKDIVYVNVGVTKYSSEGYEMSNRGYYTFEIKDIPEIYKSPLITSGNYILGKTY